MRKKNRFDIKFCGSVNFKGEQLKARKSGVLNSIWSKPYDRIARSRRIVKIFLNATYCVERKNFVFKMEMILFINLFVTEI